MPPAAGAELRPVVQDGIVRNAGGTILGADDKAAVAVMLETVRRVLAEGRPHAGIDLLFTLQEEVTLGGARELALDAFAARVGFVYDVSAPIGEVILAAPHQTGAELVFHGRSAHAGIVPEDGRSAIVAAARAIAALPSGRIDPETTLNVGIIEGGTALNVVPERCVVRVDLRSHSQSRLGEITQQVLDAAAWAANEGGCTLEARVYETCPGYQLTAADPAVAIATAALARAGFAPRHTVTGGGADTNIFNRRGLHCVTLSNGMVDIHTPDERIAVADLEAMVEVTLALVDVAHETPPGGTPMREA